MKALELSIVEPFTSPAWGSNFVVFSNSSGIVVPQIEGKDYIKQCCSYAKKYSVYLVPERFVMMDFQAMCLIDDEGNVLGAQQAVYLSPRYIHLQKGITIDVIDTEFGAVFLCVDRDLYYPEVVKIAANRGAKIIVASGGIEQDDYTNHTVVAGVWNASQSNHVFTIGATNQFNCVAAPRIIKQYSQGFVVAPTTKMSLRASISAQVLEHLPQKPRLDSLLYTIHYYDLF